MIWLISKPQEKQAHAEELDSFVVICLGDILHKMQLESHLNEW